MNLVKNYFKYMSDPQNALDSFLKTRSLKEACLGYFAAAVAWVLFFNIASGLSVPVLLLKLMIVFVAEITVGYFVASLCGLFLDFSKVKTSPAELFILIGSAGFIKGLLIALALISATFPLAKLGYLAPLALLGVLCLQLGYLTRSLMRLYHISAGKALGAWVFAVIPVTTALLLLGIFLLWGFILFVSLF